MKIVNTTQLIPPKSAQDITDLATIEINKLFTDDKKSILMVKVMFKILKASKTGDFIEFDSVTNLNTFKSYLINEMKQEIN